jgi:hypothetical protein
MRAIRDWGMLDWLALLFVLALLLRVVAAAI